MGAIGQNFCIKRIADMRAKSKILAALLIAVAAAAPARAQIVQPTAQDKLCQQMVRIDPWDVALKLRLFAGPVLGKDAERWSLEDLQGLLANAQACDGKPQGARPTVSFSQWNLKLNTVYPMIKPVIEASATVRAKYAAAWSLPGGVPLCTALFGFRKDPVWLSNNSAKVFGTPFERMGPDQLAATRSFVGDCAPVLRQILDLRGEKADTADKLAGSIEKSIDRDQKIPMVTIEDLHPSLIAYRDGKRVPLAYVSPGTVSIVRRVNNAIVHGTRIKTQDLVVISKWADDIFRLMPAGPDRAYAEKVKEAATAQMFPG